jgi:hypothetical protein
LLAVESKKEDKKETKQQPDKKPDTIKKPTITRNITKTKRAAQIVSTA